MTIIKIFPYLFAALLCLVVFLPAGKLLLTRDQWRVMILSGLANAASFPFIVFFETEYWNPIRLGGWIVGVEDLVCPFTMAAGGWLVVSLFFRNRIFANVHISWQRSRIMGSLSVGLFLLFYLMKLGGMTSLLLCCATFTVLLLINNKTLWPFALAGMVGIPPLYFLVVKVDFWLWPDFVSQWNKNNFWGATIMGLPRGEITWSMVFGAYWPLLTAHLFDVRFSKDR